MLVDSAVLSTVFVELEVAVLRVVLHRLEMDELDDELDDDES